MSTAHLTAEMIARSTYTIDTSGVVDLLVPAREPGKAGRIGNVRPNVRLLLIGLSLCTRMGHETTVRGVHQVLTEALDRQTKWDLGVLRPCVTKSRSTAPRGQVHDPDASALVARGKPRKRIWSETGIEELSYDDLHNATRYLRTAWDYGVGSAAGLSQAERVARRTTIDQVVDALIVTTTIPRTGTTWAIDATGQWAWHRGPQKRKRELVKALKDKSSEAVDDMTVNGDLATGEIAMDDEGNTTPTEIPAELPARVQAAATDAAWGFKTSKDGGKEVGYGFHQHTLVRAPDPGVDPDSEPILVDGFVITPANADVVGASLRLVDRVAARHTFTRLLGDKLYSNLLPSRWAYPLAQRGIDQGLYARSDQHKVVDIQGAQMQHSWLHCAAAPMDQRPLPPDRAGEQEWEELFEDVEDFRRHWAFDRKESGLGANLTSKWICPARMGRAGCHALGAPNVKTAIDLGLPIITPPDDWAARPCCTNKTVDFTPEIDNPDHQRKIAQREYLGSRRWRRTTKPRTRVEGAFGIMKNPSRQRLRRGQNRLPGLAMATIVAGVKVAVFNEEQLRLWHDRTGLGPADHPLLQPDPPSWGFRNLTEAEAEAIDATNMARLADTTEPLAA